MESLIERLGVDIYARTRKSEVVITRWLVWLMLNNNNQSYSQIGRDFGYHRTTVSHGIKTIKRLVLQGDDEAVKQYNKMIDYVQEIKGRPIQ